MAGANSTVLMLRNVVDHQWREKPQSATTSQNMLTSLYIAYLSEKDIMNARLELIKGYPNMSLSARVCDPLIGDWNSDYKVYITPIFRVCDPLIGDWNKPPSTIAASKTLGLWPAYRGLKHPRKGERLYESFRLWPAYRGLKHQWFVGTRGQKDVCDPLIGDWNYTRLAVILYFLKFVTRL